MPYRLRVRFPGLFRLVSDALSYATSIKDAILTYGPLTNWIVNSGLITFQQGQNQSFNVASTLPGGYTAGGTFDAAQGSALPANVSLSATGTLSDSGASAGSVSGVIFGYVEPGGIPILTLHPNATGTFPYVATAYPAEGAVPSGMTLVSPDDTNLRSNVLSTWPDGSAQVVVIAGERAVTNGVTQTIRLRPGAQVGTALTPAYLASLFTASAITVNFGGGVGTLTSTQLANNFDRIWWQNAQTICARYRLAIPGKGVMEAVIDVHAFAGGQAWVEVVIENGKVNAAAATVTAPSPQSYTNATVSVNGTTIATVSSPTAGMLAPNSRNSGGTCIYVGGHSPFRAWYCSAKVVGGTVTALTTAQQKAETFGIEVTHDIDSMMAHPWFFKRAVVSSRNLQTDYAQTYDTYVPWSFNRLRFPAMNAGGADEEIGLLTRCQADYVLSGNRYARRATLETGLAPLSAALVYRHTDGSVPTRAQVVGKNTTNGQWPTVPEPASSYPRWGGDASYVDGSHVPAIALVPFLCRPSPVYIELAQNEFLFHHTNYNSTDGSHPYDQARARGWRARNMATTIFLTPDADATRKDGYRTALVNQINTSRNFMDQGWNTYQHIYGLSLTDLEDNNLGRSRFQGANYMHWLVALCWHSIANGKVLRGADQTMMAAAADQVMAFPLRHFNDAAGYEWRGVSYQATVGVQSGNSIVPQFSNVIQEWLWDVTGTAPSAPGPWINFGTGAFNWQVGFTGDDQTSVTNQTVAGNGLFYPEHLWNVLCCAVERGVSGAEAAWTKVYGTSGNGGITNFSTWAAGLGGDRPALNRFPRGK